MLKNLLISSALVLGLTACGASETSTPSAEKAPATSDKTASSSSGKIVQTASGRDQIKIVGSSTVYPFSTLVAENFGRTTAFKTPVVESTGSGGGLKLFCAGMGANNPDITNASRRIKASEVADCAKNGINDIIEVKIGYDGIILANSRKGDTIDLTLKDLYTALAKNLPDGKGGTMLNPNKTWSDVNPALPDLKIEVLGPPSTSGTRDAFVELAMEGGCNQIDAIKAMKSSDKDAHKAICHTMREDGGFVEAGENDNLIVQKLNANTDAFGIFGYSFLEENSDSVQGNSIDGNAPTFENISSGVYPVSRSLFFYVKKDAIKNMPGVKEYLDEFMSDRASGEEGYLAEKGLIPMNPTEHAQWKKAVEQQEALAMK